MPDSPHKKTLRELFEDLERSDESDIAQSDPSNQRSDKIDQDLEQTIEEMMLDLRGHEGEERDLGPDAGIKSKREADPFRMAGPDYRAKGFYSIRAAEGRPVAIKVKIVKNDVQISDREDPARRSFIEGLKRPKLLKGPVSADAVDEGVAKLYAKYPWASEILKVLMQHMRKHARENGPYLSLPPLLLHGSPGNGKTSFARDISEIFETPLRVIEGTTLTAPFRISGAEKSWKSAVPGDPVAAIHQTDCANPLILLDEADKVTPMGGGTDPLLATLGLLERSSARHWKCNYSDIDLDMSWLNWIMTANDISNIPQPILDRMTIFEMPKPGKEFIARLIRDELKDYDVPESLQAFMLSKGYLNGGSLRRVQRMIERVKDIITAPVLH